MVCAYCGGHAEYLIDKGIWKHINHVVHTSAPKEWRQHRFIYPILEERLDRF